MTTIKLKNGSGAPTAGDLAQGEPALDLTNKRLYTEDSGGTVIEVGTNPGTDVTFADNRKAIFGAGSDLQIYHDGSNSYVEDTGDGALFLKTNGAGVFLYSGSEALATFNLNGASNLYYDNGLKLSTTSTGIDVTGVITTDGMTTSADINFGDNDKAVFGAGSDLKVYHNGFSSIIQDSGDGDLYIGSDANLLITDAALSDVKAKFVSNGEVELRYDNNVKLATTSTGIDVTGTVTADGLAIAASSPNLSVQGNSATDASLTLTSAGITSWALRNESTDSSLYFTQDGTNRAKLSSGGDISFYEDTGTTAKLFWDASAERLGIGTSSPASLLQILGSPVATSGALATFRNSDATASNTSFGGILFNSSPGTDYSIGKSNVNATTTLSFRNGNTGVSYMDIDSSGNVGIGTSSPAYPLHVAGNQFNTGWIRANTGTAANPNFTIDGGAGMFKPTSNQVAFSTNSAERMRIDSNGQVNIGTTGYGTYSSGDRVLSLGSGTTIRGAASGAPYLTAVSNGYFDGTNWKYAQTHPASNYEQYNGNHTFSYAASGTAGNNITFNEAMRIDASGQVGIGTSSPSYKLDVSSNSEVVSRVSRSAGSNALFLISDPTTTTAPYIGSYGNETAFGRYGGGESMRIDSSGNLLVGKTVDDNSTAGGSIRAGESSFVAGNSRALTIVRTTNDGSLAEFRQAGSNVGTIGVESSKLNIGNGDTGIEFNAVQNAIIPHNQTTNANVDNSIDLGFSSLRWKDLYLSGSAQVGDTTGTHVSVESDALDLYRASNPVYINASASNSDLVFRNGTSYTERMRLDSSGNLLFNGTTDLDTSHIAIHQDAAKNGITFRAPNTSAYMAMQFQNSSGSRIGYIQYSNTATTFSTSSDQRLKENIVDAPSASDDIDAIQVRSFDWKADGSHQKYGMVAQELQSVAPEAVSGDADSEDMMGVDYSKLVPMLVKEIQSLRARVAQLEGEN